jgi:adenylylsulfate kinase
MSTNLVEHKHKVTKEDRQKLLKQKSPVIWLTGLSGSGKSTIANELAIRLQEKGKLAYILDGDNIRDFLMTIEKKILEELRRLPNFYRMLV